MTLPKNPFLKFYTSDWRSDPRLRMCSAAARGLWVEMMCLMHEAEPYGHLLVNGVPPSDMQLSMLTGIPADQLPELIAELGAQGVYSRNGNGVIYSRRMTRDEKRARTARKNGKHGGNPTLSKKREIPPPDNPSDNPEDKGELKLRYQKPEVRDPPNPPPGDKLFDEFWAAYPSSQDKEPAKRNFHRAIKAGVDPALIIAGAKRYAEWLKAMGENAPKTKYAQGWLTDRRWEDELPLPLPPGGAKVADFTAGMTDEQRRQFEERVKQLRKQAK